MSDSLKRIICCYIILQSSIINFFYALFVCLCVPLSVCLTISQWNSHLTHVKARVALTLASLQIAQLCTIHLKERNFFIYTWLSFLYKKYFSRCYELGQKVPMSSLILRHVFHKQLFI